VRWLGLGLLVVVFWGLPDRLAAQAPPPPAPAASDAGHAAPSSTPAPAAQPAALEPASTPPAPAADHGAAQSHGAEEEHAESPWAVVARIFNFLVLVGLLGYFLRGPITRHLASRRQQIAADLVSARETTERAQQQLTAIDRRLKALPDELEALKARGAEEIAAEGLRIRQRAESERQRLLDQTRREVEMQVRVAKKSLAEHTADLAVKLARDQITGTITADDRARLVDRYVKNVKEFNG
jgi:F-type H+-transporting ATPase subunit b